MLTYRYPLATGILLAVVLGAACGKSSGASDDDSSEDATDGGTQPDDWTSLVDVVPGSRLRPIVRVADDGTRIHVGWHDTLFDAPCEFRLTEGVLRCLPEARGDDPWLYADPDCSQPVVQDLNFTEGQQVFLVRESGCFDASVYEIGEPVTEIYYAANGPCEFFSNDPSHRVYPLGAEEFVAATVTAQDGNSDIVPLLLEADDGARAIVGAWDKVREEEVAPDLDASGQLRWFSRWNPRVSSYYYADPACTERVAVAECIPPGERPATAIESEPGACTVVLGRYELLDETSSLYASANGGCTGSSLSAGARAWRVGEPLGDDAFAPTPTINDGGMRLRHDVYANPEGEPFLSSRSVFDVLLDEVECAWRSVPYGSTDYDCVPKGAATLSNLYADPACTQRTASRWVDEEFDCPGTPTYAYAGADGTVVPIAELLAGAGSHVLDEEGDCVAAEPDGGTDDGDNEFFLVDDSDPVPVAEASDVVE